MLKLVNEPSWLRFIGDRGVGTLEDARRYILDGPVESYARLGFGFYLVELKETGTVLGMCGLAKRDYLDDVDIGYALLPLYWGHGYVHEAAAAVLRYASLELGLKRVVATTRPDNQASVKVLEKLGLRLVRQFRRPDDDRELLLFAIDLAPTS
ncbi:GNAT family N-acetyltransferase [Chitinimonas naiadis]